MPTSKKQTSSRVSRIAAKVMGALKDEASGVHVAALEYPTLGFVLSMTVGDLKALAASCLSQDELPTPKPAKMNRRGKGRK